MKLKKNALEIAKGLATTTEDRGKQHNEFCFQLLKYEKQDWIALLHLLDKYSRTNEFYAARSNTSYRLSAWSPSTLLDDLNHHLKHGKQGAARDQIDAEIKSSLASFYKCSEVMDKVFKPIIELNKQRVRLNSLAAEVDKQSMELEKMLDEIKSDYDFQSLIN